MKDRDFEIDYKQNPFKGDDGKDYLTVANGDRKQLLGKLIAVDPLIKQPQGDTNKSANLDDPYDAFAWNKTDLDLTKS